MGMFDDVNFKMDCPRCGAKLEGFQSKDGDCTLDRIEPDAVNNFYCGCRGCGTWVEFYRHLPKHVPAREVPLTLAEVVALGFEMVADPRLTPSNKEMT